MQSCASSRGRAVATGCISRPASGSARDVHTQRRSDDCRATASAPEPAIPREHDRLCAGPYAELVEDVRGVIAHRLLADIQALRDIRIAEPAAHEREDLSLARGQGGKN